MLALVATAAQSTTGNTSQGISSSFRRHPTVLQGPSRGEEATKKLLAIGSAAEAKTRRPRGTRENPACNEVWRAHANIAALIAAAALHSLASQVLPFNGRRLTTPCHSHICCAHIAPSAANRSRSQSSGAQLRATQTQTQTLHQTAITAAQLSSANRESNSAAFQATPPASP